jgi:hypothetical protein
MMSSDKSPETGIDYAKYAMLVQGLVNQHPDQHKELQELWTILTRLDQVAKGQAVPLDRKRLSSFWLLARIGMTGRGEAVHKLPVVADLIDDQQAVFEEWDFKPHTMYRKLRDAVLTNNPQKIEDVFVELSQNPIRTPKLSPSNAA